MSRSAPRVAILSVGVAFATVVAAAAEDGRSDRRRRTRPPEPAPTTKLEPYDPDRLKGGSRPGFVDLGNGTEVRIGGRTRLDYDMRR